MLTVAKHERDEACGAKKRKLRKGSDWFGFSLGGGPQGRGEKNAFSTFPVAPRWAKAPSSNIQAPEKLQEPGKGNRGSPRANARKVFSLDQV